MQALVLRQVDYGEADRMVSLLSAERGRMELRVPQVRKSRKRFGGLDLYVLADFELARRGKREVLNSARVVNSWLGIRGSIERLALAAYAAELLLQAVPEDARNDDAFRLAVAAFASLEESDEDALGGQGWARAFELKLLHVLGARPSLRACVACGEQLQPRSLYWSVDQGGVLVGDCARGLPRTQKVSSRVIELLDRCLHLPLARQGEPQWAAQEEQQARELMVPFVRAQIGERNRARRFLDQVVGLSLAAMAAVLLFSGCSPAQMPTSVRVQGYLFSELAPADDAETVSGSAVSAFSNQGELLAEGTEPFTDYPGFYRFSSLPPSSPLHLSFGAVNEDSVATLVSGRSAEADLWVDPGTFHLWSREVASSWVADWRRVIYGKGGPLGPTFDEALPDEGGLLRGSLARPGDHLGTRLVAIDSMGTEMEVWYTDENGVPIDAQGTSSAGSFALYGLAQGPVEIYILTDEGERSEQAFVTLSVEDTVTSLFGFEVL